MYHFKSSMVFGLFIFKEFNNIPIKGGKKQNNSENRSQPTPHLNFCVRRVVTEDHRCINFATGEILGDRIGNMGVLEYGEGGCVGVWMLSHNFGDVKLT